MLLFGFLGSGILVAWSLSFGFFAPGFLVFGFGRVGSYRRPSGFLEPGAWLLGFGSLVSCPWVLGFGQFVLGAALLAAWLRPFG